MKKINTGTLYGKYCHPFGIIFNRSNIEVRKKTLKKLPFFKNIKKNAKILELGGTGQDAVAFAELGFDTTFIDLSKENIQKTKNFKKNTKVNLKLINSDFLNYNFNEKFDVIRSRGVIHHTINPSRVFLKVKKILKNKGYFHANFYRSGVFYYWFVENFRKISKNINFDRFIKVLIKTKLTSKEMKKIGNNTIKEKNGFYSIIIDDLYVPVLNPANYYDLIKDFKTLGFKIIKKNLIKNRLNHDLPYPDFPFKKNHIVFDCQNIQNKSKKIEKKLNYVLDETKENKITKKDNFIYENYKLFKKLNNIGKKKTLFDNKNFIKIIIDLYKDCYLISIQKINKNLKHKKLRNKLLKIIDNLN